MSATTEKIEAYVEHFLPRDVVGPVLVVFSLEGVIDGIFTSYVPDTYATIGWGAVFLLSLLIVAYWGTVDDEAVEELHERLDEIEEEEAAAD